MNPRRPSLLGLLVLMCTALALVIGANSSLSVALPDVAADLGASQTELAYVVNAYALVFAALLLPVGLAADRYGRRPFLVAGLLLANAAGMHAPPHYLFDLFAAGAAAATTNHHVAQALVARLPDDERVGETTPAPVATAVVAPWVQNLAAAAAASWSHAVASPEMIGAAGRIRCPTIVLWGEHDGLIPMEHGRVWAASIPGARLRVVRGAGHLVALDAPDELAAAIRALTG